MVHQYDVWVYLHGNFKRTDRVAKRFGLTTEQANHILQKIERYGHAVKEKRGLYAYWKAVEDSPPRKYAKDEKEKYDRRDEVLMVMAFQGVVFRHFISQKTGLTPRVVQSVLKSLEADGLVEKVGTKGWKMM